MTQQSTTVFWHGLELEHPQAEGAQVLATLLHESQFALIAAERTPEMPASVELESIVPHALAANAELMPRLLELGILPIPLRHEILVAMEQQRERDEQPMIAALLQTDVNVQGVATHLRQSQARSRGSQVGWLRLHDPYVFVQLPRVLGASAMPAMFGPVRSWVICLGGQWWSARVATTPTSAVRHAPINPRTQWAGLLRIAAVNRALRQLQALTLQRIVELSAHLDTLTLRAQERHGLTKVADQAAFAALGAELRHDFDEHPGVAAAIAALGRESSQSGAPDTTVIDALNNLPTATWQHVRATYGRQTGTTT